MPMIDSKVVFYQNMMKVLRIIQLHTFRTSLNSAKQSLTSLPICVWYVLSQDQLHMTQECPHNAVSAKRVFSPV